MTAPVRRERTSLVAGASRAVPRVSVDAAGWGSTHPADGGVLPSTGERIVSQLILPGASSGSGASAGDPSARGPQPGGMGLDDHIYNRLLKDRILFLGSEVRDENANAICAQLLLLAAEVSPPCCLPAQAAPGRAGASTEASASMSVRAPTGVRPIRARITIRARTIRASIRIYMPIPTTMRRRSSSSRPRPRSISSGAMPLPSRPRMQPSNTGISARVPTNIIHMSRSVRVAGRKSCRNRRNEP